MLREIDTNLWVAEQPLKYFGLNVGTRMTVIRLTNGEAIAISPIQADDALVSEINQIGEVKYIIAPNLYHHLFVANFKEIYPEAKVWAVLGLESKRPDIPIDKIINDAPNSIENQVDYLLIDGFNTLTLNGSSPLNECIFCHRPSRTLILTDIAFHFDQTFSLTTQLAARLIGSYNKLSPSLLERFATKEKNKVKQSVQQVLEWDFERVIMAHGSIIEKDGKSKFKQGYEWF